MSGKEQVFWLRGRPTRPALPLWPALSPACVSSGKLAWGFRRSLQRRNRLGFRRRNLRLRHPVPYSPVAVAYRHFSLTSTICCGSIKELPMM